MGSTEKTNRCPPTKLALLEEKRGGREGKSKGGRNMRAGSQRKTKETGRMGKKT